MPLRKIAEATKARRPQKAKPALNDQETATLLMRNFKRFISAIAEADEGIKDLMQRSTKTKAQLVQTLHPDFQAEATNLIASIVNLQEVHGI